MPVGAPSPACPLASSAWRAADCAARVRAPASRPGAEHGSATSDAASQGDAGPAWTTRIASEPSTRPRAASFTAVSAAILALRRETRWLVRSASDPADQSSLRAGPVHAPRVARPRRAVLRVVAARRLKAREDRVERRRCRPPRHATAPRRWPDAALVARALRVARARIVTRVERRGVLRDVLLARAGDGRDRRHLRHGRGLTPARPCRIGLAPARARHTDHHEHDDPPGELRSHLPSMSLFMPVGSVVADG